jgi:hypothetical protein
MTTDWIRLGHDQNGLELIRIDWTRLDAGLDFIEADLNIAT